MAAADALPPEDGGDTLVLRPGPHWDSFEQFRILGPKLLQAQLGDDQVGRLTVKSQTYLVLSAAAFDRLYGLAQDARRLSAHLQLVQQAVRLLSQTHGSSLAVEHLRDLALRSSNHLVAPFAEERELVFELDEQAELSEPGREAPDFELDPSKVTRPAFRHTD